MPSPALVKAALINSANELDTLNGGPGPIPNHDEGWGRITLTNIIVTNLSTAPRYYEYVDQTTLLTNGQVYRPPCAGPELGSAAEDHSRLYRRRWIPGRDSRAGKRSGPGGRRSRWDALPRQPVRWQ